MKLIIMISSILLLISCVSTQFKYEIINNKQITDISKQSTVDDFFKRRMENESYRKIQGSRRWNICQEDSSFVYYAYSNYYDSCMDCPRGNVDTIYKVDKKELYVRFQNYKTMQGYNIRKLIYDTILTIGNTHDWMTGCNEGYVKIEYDLDTNQYIAKIKYYCKYGNWTFFNKVKMVFQCKAIINKDATEIIKTDISKQ